MSFFAPKDTDSPAFPLPFLLFQMSIFRYCSIREQITENQTIFSEHSLLLPEISVSRTIGNTKCQNDKIHADVK